MEVSGEVADLLVKEGLQVAELAMKLSAKGAVNAAALLAAMAKQHYKVVGKVGIDRLMKENAESVVIPIRETDLANFEKIARQFGVLFAAAKSEGRDSGVVHIISNVNYSAQLNAVLEAMGYGVPQVSKEEQTPKKARPRAPQEKSSNERGNGLNKQPTDTTPKKPSVRNRLAALDAVAKEMSKGAPVRQTERNR